MSEHDLPPEAVRLLVAAHHAYLEAQPCPGAQRAVFVPHGRTIEDVWAELSTMGRIDVGGDGLVWLPDGVPRDGVWAQYRCEGGARCSCRGVDIDPAFTDHYNGRQVWPPLKEG